MPLGMISCLVHLKLFPIYIQKRQAYLNSVRQAVLENMYVWNFFILFVLKNEIVFQKDYKVYHYGITFRL